MDLVDKALYKLDAPLKGTIVHPLTTMTEKTKQKNLQLMVLKNPDSPPQHAGMTEKDKELKSDGSLFEKPDNPPQHAGITEKDKELKSDGSLFEKPDNPPQHAGMAREKNAFHTKNMFHASV